MSSVGTDGDDQRADLHLFAAETAGARHSISSDPTVGDPLWIAEDASSGNLR
jgi:hypothetical protein